jgi:hypothetical protein
VNNAFTLGISKPLGGIGIKNNLVYDCQGSFGVSGAVTSHNATGHTNPVPDDNNLQVYTTSPLVDGDNYDFSLKAATDPGLTLAAPYNMDMYGNVRGADGVWDRGAIEYSKTNIERRMSNAERRIHNYPTPINGLRLSINDVRIFNSWGKLVSLGDKNKAGIYFIKQPDNSLKKVILVK